MTTANRGKHAENLLKTYLTKLAKQADTVFYRLPDAHSGAFTPTLADFLLLNKGQLYLIECKQVNHTHRLPYSNFKDSQVARMRVWQLAGAQAVVLIYHTPLDAWRGLPLDHFLDRSQGGSWDLSAIPTVKLEDLI